MFNASNCFKIEFKSFSTRDFTQFLPKQINRKFIYTTDFIFHFENIKLSHRMLEFFDLGAEKPSSKITSNSAAQTATAAKPTGTYKINENKLN
jgi:hypothetical protein